MSNATPFPLPDRFWAKTRQDADGCLIWTAAKNNQGYGVYGWLGTTQLAHRVALLAASGIPEGLHVDHLCRVRLCVNPEHLEAITPAENNRRMIAHLTTVYPSGRRYPTVTHEYVERGGLRASATHTDKLYARARCPRCPDKAA